MSEQTVQLTDTEIVLLTLAGVGLTKMAMGQTKEQANAPGRKGHGRFFWDNLFNRIYGRR